MQINQQFVEMVFYLSLVIAAPGLFQISRAVTRHLLARYLPSDRVIIRYVREGRVVKTVELNTTSYVVDQLKLLKNAGVQGDSPK